ncbi:MAG: XRE family transcriptional regulator [Candidatus Sedimenticola sp. (ex Thyasira tokunagai)]
MSIEKWQAIKAARKAAGLSQEKLGAACDPPVSKAAVGLWESANPLTRTTPKYDNLQTIYRLTGFSMERLLLVNIHGGVIEDTYSTPDQSRGAHANTLPGPETKGLIPLISWVNAGNWAAVEDPYEVGDAEDWKPCPVSHGHHTFALRVRGSSMEPEYRHGDIIYVDPDRRHENGSHVIARLDDEQEATFKKLVIEGSAMYLEALNPSWPDKVIKINGNANIVGVVIFSGRER